MNTEAAVSLVILLCILVWIILNHIARAKAETIAALEKMIFRLERRFGYAPEDDDDDDDDDEEEEEDDDPDDQGGKALTVRLDRRTTRGCQNISCPICSNEQCQRCNGRACVKCGMEIPEPG
jgi:hypothetical protein